MRQTKLAVILLTALLAQPAVAFQNEPDGFRGIKWGSDVAANAKELTSVSDDGAEALYVRRGDKLQIGGAELRRIVYVYYKKQFSAIAIETKGSLNKDALLKAFTAQFGPGAKPNQFIETYLWDGAVTRIGLKCNSISDSCSVYMFSTEFANRRHQEQEKAAAGAGKDF